MNKNNLKYNKHNISGIVSFKYNYNNKECIGIDLQGLIKQLEDLEISFDNYNMPRNYEAIYKSLKEILKQIYEDKNGN